MASKATATAAKRAVGYIRVSTRQQAVEGESLDAQRNKIRLWCELNDCVLGEVYADEGISGSTTQKRTGFQQAVAAARDGVTLVVYSISRAARSTEDLLQTVNTIKQQGGNFASVIESVDVSNSLGKFFLTILGAVAELESSTIRERCQLGRQAKRDQGKVADTLRYGFMADDNDNVIPHPAEQANITTAEGMKADGHTLQAIADYLNAHGRFTRKGTNWTRQAVNQSLLRVGQPVAVAA